MRVEWVNEVLGSEQSLDKGLEPDRADEMISISAHRNLFSAETASPYWRLIRKGTAPAFLTRNIKYAF